MKQLLISFSILFCIVVSTSLVQGQKHQGNYNILLKSGTQTLVKNVDEFIQSPNLTTLESNADYIYRYVQFDEMPTTTQKVSIANLGIKLLEYIPHKTYIAALPTGMNFQSLKSVNVRAVHKVEVNHKLDDYLLRQEYPDWTTKGEEIKLTVQLYEAKNRKKLLSSLAELNAELVKIHYGYNLVHILVKKDDASIRAIADLPFVNYLEIMPAPSKPDDVNGTSLQRNNQLNQMSANGLKYDGTGISILVRDDGSVGPHIDFQGRIDQVDAASHPFQGTHGDGVAGVWTGAGNLDPLIQGGAPGADLYITGYVADFLDTTYGMHLYHGVNVTNSSYSNGCNSGYTTVAQTVDGQIWNSPSLIHIFSAGNSNNNNCGYGAGNQWGNITGGHKIGKNTIATADIDSVGGLASWSSRGPASDGRLKPDMAAYGTPQVSTDEDNTYQDFGGTSSAAPSGAGVYTQLLHAYKDLNGGADPESGLIKATVMNTATDLGNVGPDFKFGWGLYNGGKAYHLLADNRYLSDSITQGINNTHTFTIPANVKEARIMVYWMEPSGAVLSAKALINDIDMTVSDGTTTTLPLVLNHAPNATTLDAPAAPGVDNLNNVEQVRLTNPAAGTYTVNVNGAVIPLGATKYYVLYEYITEDIKVTYPNGGEGLIPSKNNIIHWDTYGNSGTFSLDYSTDGGANWNVISASVPGSARDFDWTTPASVTGNALVRVTRGAIQDVSDTTFTIIGRPSNIAVDTACVNGLTISWNAVNGATSYDIMILGDKYMDSLLNTTTTSGTVLLDPLQAQWFTVRARVNDGVGTRANAKFYGGGLLNCILQNELEMASLTPNGNVQCALDTIVSVDIINAGQNSQSNFSVSYQLDQNTVVTETVTSTIMGGQTLTYNFNTPIYPVVGVEYDLKVWNNLGDNFSQNDTLTTRFEYSNTHTAPFTENFEGFNIANTDWVFENPDAGITWDVIPSITGSDGSSTTTMFMNFYDYANATGAEDYAYTPVQDLSNLTQPILTFDVAYVMYSNTLNDGLKVEISDDCGTTFTSFYDKSAAILATAGTATSPWSPSSANDWRKEVIDLTSIAGGVASIRFVAVNGYGNGLYIDNINICGTPTAAFSYTANNEDVTFNNTSTQGTSYSWDFGDGNTSTAMSPNHTYDSSGVYTVTLTTINDCATTTTTMTVDVIFTNVLDVAQSWKVNVFPNPNSGQFTVKLDGINDDVNISILNTAGQLMRSWNYDDVKTGWTTTINASELAKGLYLLKIETKDGIKNLKLAIQ